MSQLSKRVQSRVRHKMMMFVSTLDWQGRGGHSHGPDRTDEEVREIQQEAARAFERILPDYEAKGATAALWLARLTREALNWKAPAPEEGPLGELPEIFKYLDGFQQEARS